MQKIKKSLIPPAISLIVFIILTMPAALFGAGLIPECDTKTIPGRCIWGWREFMALINGLINFVLFKMALPIAAIMFAYAGFKLITAGGEAAHARTKAKEIFLNTLIGLVIAAAAWLVISTLLSILGYDGSWIGLKIKK